MDAIPLTELRDDLGNVVNRVAIGRERVVLQRNGKDTAAIVPMEDLELLRQIEDRMDLADARKALAEVKRKGTLSWDKLKAELGL